MLTFLIVAPGKVIIAKLEEMGETKKKKKKKKKMKKAEKKIKKTLIQVGEEDFDVIS